MKPLLPLAMCTITDNQTDTVTIWWAYDNKNDHIINVPKGSDNHFISDGLVLVDKGQPTTFYPGRHVNVLSSR